MGSAALPVLALQGVGMAVSTAGAYSNSQAQNQANEYNAQIMERNAQLADRQAQQEIEAGKIQEKKLRHQIAQMQGSQRAAMGATGVRVNEGSALDVYEDTSAQGEEDALNMRYNYGQNAYSRQMEAYNYRNQAALTRFSNTSPISAGFNSMLSGSSSLGESYAGYVKGYGGKMNPLKWKD